MVAVAKHWTSISGQVDTRREWHEDRVRNECVRDGHLPLSEGGNCMCGDRKAGNEARLRAARKALGAQHIAVYVESRGGSLTIVAPFTADDAAALADRLEQAERDKAAVRRVRELLGPKKYPIAQHRIRAALDGTEADR
jgi:hypothetical protein